jgi:hypothetical protein
MILLPSDLDTCAAANASLKGEWIAAAANTPVIVFRFCFALWDVVLVV